MLSCTPAYIFLLGFFCLLNTWWYGRNPDFCILRLHRTPEAGDLCLRFKIISSFLFHLGRSWWQRCLCFHIFMPYLLPSREAFRYFILLRSRWCRCACP